MKKIITSAFVLIMLSMVSFAANRGNTANEKPLYKGAEYKAGTFVNR